MDFNIKEFSKKLEGYLRDHTLLFLVLIYFILLIIAVKSSTFVIEPNLVLVITLIVLVAVYLTLFVNILCRKSRLQFFRKNSFLFQLPILILSSIVVGAILASVLVPVNFPLHMILGPIEYQPTQPNLTGLSSPMIIFVCKQGDYKNLIANGLVNCKLDSHEAGWNSSKIDRVELIRNDSVSFFYPDTEGSFSFRLDKDDSYEIRAYYGGYFISLTPFRDKEILDMEEYHNLMNQRLGLIGAFVIFALSVLTSFLKNTNEML